MTSAPVIQNGSMMVFVAFTEMEHIMHLLQEGIHILTDIKKYTLPENGEKPSVVKVYERYVFTLFSRTTGLLDSTPASRANIQTSLSHP